MAVGDFNGDGYQDLVVTNEAAPAAASKSCLNNGNGTFTAQTPITTNIIQPYAVAVGDFDGDGNLDLAVVNLAAAASTATSPFS